MGDITVDGIYLICDDDNHRLLSDEEANTIVVFKKCSIQFGYRTYSKDMEIKKTYQFPSKTVTIKNFVEAIIDFEKLVRPISDGSSYSEIDTHHIFYDGINQEKRNGPYFINWGS